MDTAHIVKTIDEEIDRLQRARSLVTGHVPPLKRGLPTKKRRKMSAEGRARIAAAQKARWAKARLSRRAPKDKLSKLRLPGV